MNSGEFKNLAETASDIVMSADKFLEHAGHVSNAVPFVQSARDSCKKLTAFFEKSPSGYAPQQTPQIQADLAEAKRLFASVEYKGPIVMPNVVSGFSGVSGAANIANSIVSVAVYDTSPAIRSWATQMTPVIHGIQLEEMNLGFIRGKLKTLHQGLDTEFDRAVADYRRAVAGTAEPTAAGIALRNVMEGMSGNLSQLARIRAGRNQGLNKWADMAAVVARGAPSSYQVSQLITQKTIYDGLHDGSLTPIAKGDKNPTAAEWEAIFSSLVGLLTTVLGLVDFQDGT